MPQNENPPASRDGADLASVQRAIRDIPGTFVFDAARSRQGYHLNMFCTALKDADNRAAFKADEAAFLARFPLDDAQRQAVLARDYNRMLALGGNIYFLSKIAAVDGHNFQQIAARMSGMAFEDFRHMMLSGGRSPADPVGPVRTAPASEGSSHG